MATYSFRLVDVTVCVKSVPGAMGPRFESQVMDASGQIVGRGKDWTEPGAVGLAVLSAGQKAGIQNVD